MSMGKSYFEQEKEMLFEILGKASTSLNSNSGGPVLFGGVIAAFQQAQANLPQPTSIGSGDKIRLDAISLFPQQFPFGKTSLTPSKQQGAYYYLSKVLNNPKAGSTPLTGITKKIPGYNNIFLSSGFGNRNVGKGRHEGIDIAQAGGGLPMTCPFQKAVVEESSINYNIMTLYELDPSTDKKTGRGCRFLHSPFRKVKKGEEITFGYIVGQEGTVGAGGASGVYASHSHFEMFIDPPGNYKEVTVDGKSTTPSNITKNRRLIAPTLEEIKCAHGMSKTPLRLPDITESNGIINYSCI